MFHTDSSTRRRRLAGLVAGAALAGLLIPTTAEAQTSPALCERRNNSRYETLLECVTVDGVREHQAAFQAIADANGGTRADQTPGYAASVDYVVDTMSAAGWDVEVVPFTYPGTDVVLQQRTPVVVDHPFDDAIGSGEGDVTAPVVPVDVNLVGDRQNTSGCEMADFAAFPAGAIALLQRGTCPFAQKAQNAQAAGAQAVVLFNQGDSIGAGDRFGVIANPTLGTFVASVPVVGTSFAAGESLAQPNSTARVKVDFVTRESVNVIAEKKGVNDDNVVMAGAHLDSVPAGPGINDNASGSSALLEIGQNLARHRPVNTLRFAWWGAEEVGLRGSTAWVNQQVAAGTLDEIALYLNFDMIGSPNYYIGVYDADQSSYNAPVPVPAGSAALEDVFESYYTLVDEPYDDTEFSGRSDYQAFINNNIPASGLFTGAEVEKTPEQQAIWGGTAGTDNVQGNEPQAQFDPCYHIACDDLDNVALHALDVNTDAIAFAVLTFAYSTESVNGVPGMPVPGSRGLPLPNGPEGTCPGQPMTPCKLAGP